MRNGRRWRGDLHEVVLLLCACLCSAVVFAQTAPPAFKDPPAAFRPIPFWALNGSLDDEELRWQAREFKDKGFGGYLLHARAGLVTRYLGDEWLHKVGVCLEEGRRAGLDTWLFDEDRGPSGFAGGLATQNRPEFAAMGLHSRAIAPGELANAIRDPRTIAVFDVDESSFRRVASTSDQPRGQFVWFFGEPNPKSNRYNGETYVDVLNPEAVAHFLKITFTDGYDRRFRKDYGAGIQGVFTDEPNFRPVEGARDAFPWTRRFPDLFREKHGYDLVEKLPLLAYPLPGFEQVRYDFWRTAAEQFEAAYSRPYAEMAGRLGLKLTGHSLAHSLGPSLGPSVSNDALSQQAGSGGSVMLHSLHQQIPGSDRRRRGIAEHAPRPINEKQASSVAHQFGRERVLSEIFGGSGHSAGFEDLKRMADFQFALGVNLLAPHLSLYSMAGARKRDFPPTFSYHQPYWPYMKLLNDYLARASWFVTQGKSQKGILVLEPLGSAWAHWAPGARKPEAVESVERRFNDTLEALLVQHRDFDLGNEIILERHARVEKGELRVGPEGRYTMVVAPPAFRWSESTARLLDQFLAAGGRVIFRGPQPAAVQQFLTHRNAAEIGEPLDDFIAALEKAAPDRKISIAADGREIGDILYQHRFDGIRHYFFLANTSRDKAHRAAIRVDLAGMIEEWDLKTGEVRSLKTLDHEFPPAGSFAFAVDISGTSEPLRMPVRVAEPRTESVAGPFKFKRLQPNTLVLDWCRYSINGGPEQGPAPVSRARRAALEAAGLAPYAGVQPWALAAKNVAPRQPVRVKMRFDFESEVDQPRAWLVVEKLGDFEVQVNGADPERTLRVAGAADGWQWDKQFGRVSVAGRIRRGANRIELAAAYKPGVEIEDIFLVGDFATSKVSDTRYVLVAEPMELKAGNWVEQGYHFYSGNISYQVPVDFQPGERVMLRLKQPAGSAFVVLAGTREVARLGWQPWEADVTAALKPGRNVLDVVVLGSLQNTFGPLHNKLYQKDGYDGWMGPDSFADPQNWTDAYYHAPYGLGGIELVRSRASGRKSR